MTRKVKIALMGSSGYVGSNLHDTISVDYSDLEVIPVHRDGYEEMYSQYRIFDFLERYRKHWHRESYYDEPDDEYYDIVKSDGPQDLVELLHDTDVLVNLSGSGRQSAKNPYSVSVEAPAAVAAFACKEAGGIPIIHVSGLGASSSVPVAYLASKYAAESAVKKSKLPHVILRPSYIVGDGDHLSSYVIQSTKTRRNNAAGNASTATPRTVDVYDSMRPIQPIHIDDAVSVIIWAVRMLADAGRDNNNTKNNHTLDLVGPDKIPFYDYMAKLTENAGAVAKPISMDEAFARALKNPESASFGVDDLGIIAGGYTGNYEKLVKTTGTRPESVAGMLESGYLP